MRVCICARARTRLLTSYSTLDNRLRGVKSLWCWFCPLFLFFQFLYLPTPPSPPWLELVELLLAYERASVSSILQTPPLGATSSSSNLPFPFHPILTSALKRAVHPGCFHLPSPTHGLLLPCHGHCSPGCHCQGPY